MSELNAKELGEAINIGGQVGTVANFQQRYADLNHLIAMMKRWHPDMDQQGRGSNTSAKHTALVIERHYIEQRLNALFGDRWYNTDGRHK